MDTLPDVGVRTNELSPTFSMPLGLVIDATANCASSRLCRGRTDLGRSVTATSQGGTSETRGNCGY